MVGPILKDEGTMLRWVGMVGRPRNGGEATWGQKMAIPYDNVNRKPSRFERLMKFGFGHKRNAPLGMWGAALLWLAIGGALPLCKKAGDGAPSRIVQ